VIGQAWEESNDKEVKLINCLIDIGRNNDLTQRKKFLQVKIILTFFF
jgi:hypothetical protein